VRAPREASFAGDCGGDRACARRREPAGVAQNAPPGLPVIRDAEIEQLLRDYTAPILRAAGSASRTSRSC
jgi:predicted Zn-dependent protease